MFGLFHRKEKAVGEKIAYFGLTRWWLSEFSKEERDLIRRTYEPLGMSGEILDREKISFTSEDVLHFISNLASWFRTEGTRQIAYKILRKADEYMDADLPVLSKHFAMQIRCETYYRWRNHDHDALQETIISCEKGIALSQEAAALLLANGGFIPSNRCFKQLAIIEEKRGNLNRAISLCRQALVDGWAGDWDTRIIKLERKLKNSPNERQSDSRG